MDIAGGGRNKTHSIGGDGELPYQGSGAPSPWNSDKHLVLGVLMDDIHIVESTTKLALTILPETSYICEIHGIQGNKWLVVN